MTNIANSDLVGKSIKLKSIQSKNGNTALSFDDFGRTFVYQAKETSGSNTLIVNANGINLINDFDLSSSQIGSSLKLNKNIIEEVTTGGRLPDGLSYELTGNSLDSYSGITSGNNVWITVADDAPNYNYSVLLRSTDFGQNWSVVRSGVPDVYMYSSAYGNGVFVVSYENYVTDEYGFLYSTDDGITWTFTPSPDDLTVFWSKGIVYANNKFVASSQTLGSNGYALYSSDGITWNKSNPISPGSGWNLGGIAYGNGVYVAGGNGNDFNNKIAYSSDGITWNAVTVNSIQGGGTYTGFYRYPVFADGKFVIIGGYGSSYAATSTDGATWTTLLNNTGLSMQPYSVYFDTIDEKWYANQNAGLIGPLAESTDGRTWINSSITLNTEGVRGDNNNGARTINFNPVYLDGKLVFTIYDNDLDNAYLYIVNPGTSENITTVSNTTINAYGIKVQRSNGTNSSNLTINSNSLYMQSDNSSLFASIPYTSLGNSTVNTQIFTNPRMELKINKDSELRFAANDSVLIFEGNNITVGNSTIAESGYTYLNNGMLLQWGSVYLTGSSSQVVSFNTPFPVACLYTHLSGRTGPVTAYVNSSNTTAMRVTPQDYFYTANWIAIGM